MSLNLVSGLHVEFDSVSPPLQQWIPPPLRFEDWEVHIIDQELATLLRKGVVEDTFHEETFHFFLAGKEKR